MGNRFGIWMWIAVYLKRINTQNQYHHNLRCLKIYIHMHTMALKGCWIHSHHASYAWTNIIGRNEANLIWLTSDKMWVFLNNLFLSDLRNVSLRCRKQASCPHSHLASVQFLFHWLLVYKNECNKVYSLTFSKLLFPPKKQFESLFTWMWQWVLSQCWFKCF